MVVQLMELYRSIPGMEIDPQLPVQIANAKYFSICALGSCHPLFTSVRHQRDDDSCLCFQYFMLARQPILQKR
jgi:hypothetical protein